MILNFSSMRTDRSPEDIFGVEVVKEINWKVTSALYDGFWQKMNIANSKLELKRKTVTGWA